ncbi:MAG: type II secretion system protein GspN [Proteobacteria bacterium]|nr:type II secretion system protein GspN [Pseudomonadota bacterium]
MRKVVRGIGFFVLALVTFVFGVQLTFPYDRVKAKIVDALSEKYDASIGDVERGFLPGTVTFKAISIKTRPAQADLDRVAKIEDEKERAIQRALLVTTVFVDKLEVHLGVLALIGGKVSVDLDTKIGSGQIAGSIAVSKDGTEIDLEGHDLPGLRLPLREAFSGLPLDGKVQFSVVADLPNVKNKAGKVGPDWSKAEAAISFECPSNCTLGDGVAKFHPKVKKSSEATVKDGLDFNKLFVQSMVAKLEVKKGVAEITKFEMASKDLEMHLQLLLNLAPEVGDSMAAGCFRYKPSEELLKREPKTYSAFMLIGGPLGPDKLFHVKLDGKVKDLKKLALTCGPTTNQAMDDFSGTPKPAKPNLAPPEEPTRVPAAPTIPHDAMPPTPVTSAGSATAGSAGSGSGSATVPLRPPGPEHEENPPVGSGSAHEGGEGSAAPAPEPTIP